MLHPSPPSAIAAALEHMDLEEGAAPLLAAAADLSPEGRPEPHWLVATPRFLTVFSEGPEGPKVIRSLPLEEIESFRATGGFGSGFLQALVDGVWIDLVRYSNGLAGQADKVAARLEDLRRDGTLTLEASDLTDDRRCPSCGLALNFAGDVCPRCIDRGAIFKRVWKLMRPYRWPATVMSLLILLGVAAELAPPKLQEYMVDHVLRPDPDALKASDLVSILLIIVASLAATRLFLAVVNAIKGIIANRIGTALTSDLRGQLVEKLQGLAVDFYDRHPAGVLVSRVAHDTEAMYGLIHQLTGGFLMQILQVIGVGIMLFTLNAKLALWTLIPMPLVFYGSWFFWKRVYPRYYRYWDSSSKQAGALAGMLAGIRVVKAFAQEKREYARFTQASHALRDSRLEVEVASAIFSSAMALVFSLGGLIVWYVGGRGVLGGEMSLGALMAYLAYLAMFYAPLTTLAQLTTWLTSFLTASQRVFELLDTPVRIMDPEKPAPLKTVQGAIRFEDVTFGYERGRTVLRDFNLDIHPGENVGVVGRSGSGKTTLVNLISRFYDVDSGKVTIDGVDVREVPHLDLRRHIGVVLQEPFLFRGTIWDNLVYGRPEAPVEEALTAAAAANVHDFVMRKPLAYDSYLGERGAGLSGGEKQRMSIARALLFNPRILILDEATSAVDTESEKAIQDALAILCRGRTTIAIAHRLSTLRNADRILVMDHGKLIEEGPHAELMALGGVYARLVRIQTEMGGQTEVDRFLAEGSAEETPSAGGGGTAVATLRRTRKPPRTEKPAGDGSGNEPGDLSAFGPTWLDPKTAKFRRGPHGTLDLQVGERLYSGLFVVRALPASRPDEYLSVRYADEERREHEAGMVRRLADWSADDQALLREALNRRYFLRRITGIRSIQSRYNLLTFQVRTDGGDVEFTMRNQQSQAQEYGHSGKLLIDVDDNRFFVEDVNALPAREQALFRRHIYW